MFIMKNTKLPKNSPRFGQPAPQIPRNSSQAVNQHKLLRARKCVVCVSKICETFLHVHKYARTHTLIHYQVGHQESYRKLALLGFPVHPSDGSPLFLETEDRVHPHTHTHQAAAVPQISLSLTTHTYTHSSPWLFFPAPPGPHLSDNSLSYSLHSPFNWQLLSLSDKPQKGEVT